MRGVTILNSKMVETVEISTHTPHARCDGAKPCFNRCYGISTHTPHARCDAGTTDHAHGISISTHTPHARCDLYPWIFSLYTNHFYSHTSCEVWRKPSKNPVYRVRFLLTHLMRGVTSGGFTISAVPTFISTHTPHARCDLTANHRIHFYSHTSCEVWPPECWRLDNRDNFYSHTSCEVWRKVSFRNLLM